MTKTRTIIAVVFSGACALLSLHYLRALPDHGKLNPKYPFKDTFSMPYYAHAFSFSGFRSAVADMLWVDIVQYIGDPENTKAKYPDLFRKINNLNNLDPNFTYPYLSVSGIYMFELKDTDTALKLIDKGIERNPDYWVLHLYRAAYTYSMNYDKNKKTSDLEKTVSRLEKAVEQKGHPPMLERILGSFYLKLAEVSPEKNRHWTNKAVRLWANMYEKPTEELNRRYAEEQLRKYGLLKN